MCVLCASDHGGGLIAIRSCTVLLSLFGLREARAPAPPFGSN